MRMSHMRLVRFGVLLASLVFLLVSCTSTSVVETPAPIVEEPVVEVVVSPDPAEAAPVPPSSRVSLTFPDRYVKVRPVPRYGDRLVVTNQTGYTLNSLDLFSDTMYLNSPYMRNLFGDEPLADRDSRDIVLDQHPDLKAAVETRDGSLLTLNALDLDGDMYYRAWDPEADPWHIIMTLEDLDYSYMRKAPENQGEYFEVWNKTGYPLVELNLEDTTSLVTDFGPAELLEGFVLAPGEIVRIQVADVPWIASQLPFDVYGRVDVTAKDSDGDSYVKYWHPTSDSWLVELTADDLAWLGPDEPKPSGERQLHVTNNSGLSIWFLYIVAGDMIDLDAYGDDLLGADVLYDGDSMWVDLAQATHLDSYLSSPSDYPAYLVAEDGLGDQYVMPWNPSVDSWKIVLTAETLTRKPHSGQVWEPKMLSVTNNSGFDIWYLHLVTEEMFLAADFGEDLLGSELLNEGSSMEVDLTEVGHLDSYLEDAAREEPLNLIAIDLLDDVYIMPWNPHKDSWTITLTEQSFSSEGLPEPVYGYVPLSVVNRTGEDIWFLYLATDAMYAAQDEGSDVLDDDVLYADDTFHLVPEKLRWVHAAFQENPEAAIHVIGYTYDDIRFHRRWSPLTDGWIIELDEEDLAEK